MQWTGNGVATCTAGGVQEYPQLVSDGNYGVIITWTDMRSGDYDLYAQQIDDNGILGNCAPLCIPPVVNLGADITQCGGTVLLDAGNAGATYLWSDSSTNQTLTVSDNGCTNGDTIHIDILTALPEGTAIEEILIYPNPNNGIFQIQVGGAMAPAAGNQYSLEICNVLGKKILSQKILPESSLWGKSEIDLSSQSNGIYFIHLQTDKERIVKKLIINK